MTSLELEVNITQNDITTFALLNYYRRISTRIMLVLVLFFLIFLFFSYNANGESNYMVLIGFVVCLFYLVFIPVIIFLKARHNFLSEKKFKDPIHWIFTPEKVEVKGHGFSSHFLWSSVYKVIELKKMFLIYHNSNSANVIPKQNWQSEDL